MNGRVAPPPGRLLRRERGTSIIEFTLVLPLLLIMVLALIEFGHLIQSRLIVANVSREGGSIASRTVTSLIDANLATLVAISGHPIILNGPNGKVIITRVDAGTVNSTAPKITKQVISGSYSQGSVLGAGKSNLGLPANLYNHLVYKPAIDASEIGQLTMVEVYYSYKPITPLPKFLPGLIAPTGLVLQSKAIF